MGNYKQAIDIIKRLFNFGFVATEPTFAFLTPAPSKSDVARVRLLAAALDVFGRKGPDGATVREIAEAAGQNVAAISYYFGSKEALYLELIRGIIVEMRIRVGEVIERAEARRNAGPMKPREAEALLDELLRTLYLRALGRDETLALSRLIAREQMQPTAAFDIIYEQGIRRLHETLTFLVAAILGMEPSSPLAVARAHTLLGQVIAFAVARETFIRRMGWEKWETEQAVFVADVVSANLRAMFAGLRCSARADGKTLRKRKAI